MGGTTYHTPFYPLDYPADGYMAWRRASSGSGVRVTEPDALIEALPETLTQMLDIEARVTGDEYPREEWQYLMGFTYDDELEVYWIDNCYPRDFAETLATVSQFTEPLQCYLSTTEGDFPHAVEVARTGGTILLAEAENGHVDVDRVEIGQTEREHKLSTMKGGDG